MSNFAYCVEYCNASDLAVTLRNMGAVGWRLHSAFERAQVYTLIFEQARATTRRKKHLRLPDRRGIKAIDDFEEPT